MDVKCYFVKEYTKQEHICSIIYSKKTPTSRHKTRFLSQSNVEYITGGYDIVWMFFFLPHCSGHLMTVVKYCVPSLLPSAIQLMSEVRSSSNCYSYYYSYSSLLFLR